ncbi:MAG TPA: DUF899 family protein [Ktedonobacteraceae bacterium]
MSEQNYNQWDESKNGGLLVAGGLDISALPAVVDRAPFQAELDRLRVREKAHTREGDAIAAARRRLPMVEVAPTTPLIGPNGPLTLLDAFEGCRQLIAYYFMWNPGRPAPEQCEGCTWVTSQVRELSYLHSRDITYAVFCQGPYDESVRYRDFMGWDMPWYSAQDSLGVEAMDNSYALMDLTVYGRQEPWEDSPPGWPHSFEENDTGDQLRINGRPIAQWSRLAAGRSDDLGNAVP